MSDDLQAPDIIPEATAKRRLLIYTLVRLAGLVVLAAGILRLADRVDAIGVVLVVIGGISLFVRPRLLARALGRRW